MSQQYSPPSPTSGGTGHVLPAERAKCSFNVAALEEAMGGTKAKRAKRIEDYAPLFNKEPFNDGDADHFLSYEDQFKKQIARASAAVQIARTNPKFRQDHMAQRVSMVELFNTGALGIHFIAYLPFLESQASDEQKKKWLPGARSLEYVAAYAQTELGHGSNVRALETTATFDEETDEIVIHSPTLTSIKWWPTAMYSVTHGAVMANLIVKGKALGFHSFFVQFRDHNGKCMPGVEVGEIGPKVAGRHTNIGYARFTHVRVPRDNMFSRNQQLLRDGTYVPAPPKFSKFGYIGMMSVRNAIIAGTADALARASTTAVRYLCIREQGFADSTAEDPFQAGERKVLDYQLHQYRTFKALAFTYIFQHNVKTVRDFFNETREAMLEGGARADAAATQMPELHATLCGMKCFCTTISLANIEALRKSFGGQGFLKASGLWDIIGEQAEVVTSEGEHVTLVMQLVRYLVKSVRAAKNKETLEGAMVYLNEPPVTAADVQGGAALAPGADPGAAHALLLRLMRDRARRFAYKLEDAFSAQERKGGTFDDALNRNMNLGWKAAECHTLFALVQNTWTVVAKIEKVGVAEKAVLLRLFELACLQQIWENQGDFMLAGLDEQGCDMARDRMNDVLEALRPDAVGLVDALNVPDSKLHTTLGNYDGNVYEAIYETAKASPLNQTEAMVGWDDFKSIVDEDFMKEGYEWQRQGEVAPGKAKL